MTYDGAGRPTSGTSPYGAVTTYSYTPLGTIPVQQTESGPNGVTITTLDGLGRAIRVQRGDSATVDASTSYTDTVYAPCACSPLGKVQKVSQPYAPGGTPVWTVYTYDGIGRTVSVVQPDGASTTTYSYSGNQSTVTDPAGNWKQFTKDVLGNLTTVLEPDPANQPGGTLTTTYAYDWMNHVTSVSMTRAGTTQTRSFVYDSAGRLTSATNPENGTVTYTYNSDNTLQDKHDAKGQDTVYTYDSQKRVTMIQRYPNGKNNGEDQCQRVTYSYDTNPYSSTFSNNSHGRLTAARYTPGTCIASTLTEMYSYHPAGAVTAKSLQVGSLGAMTVNYGYNSAGQVETMQYPSSSSPTLIYGYDSMGRLYSLNETLPLNNTETETLVPSTQYDLAGRMSSVEYPAAGNCGSGYVFTQETMSYNVNGQLASLNWGNGSVGGCLPQYLAGGPVGGIQYSYSATQNNGQITQAVDTLSGETIGYNYDRLKRLTSASSTPNTGSTTAAWTQTYQYDGFGNLTAKVLNGTSTPIAVSAATNHLSNANYDGNGNMTSGVSATLTYDVANRLATASEVSGGMEYYGYAPDNKRVFRQLANGQQQFTLYGAKGEKLAIGTISGYTLSAGSAFVWFGGRLISDENGPVYQDRLGTNRASGTNTTTTTNTSYGTTDDGARFYPYGDEITSTANDHVKFGTYTRDSYTGLDYADQRFYASSYGRFNTPDPSKASVANGSVSNPSDPGSWNKYAYTRGDPVNRFDRRLDDSGPELLEGDDDDDDDDDGWAYGPVGPVYFAPPGSTGGGGGGAPPCNPTGSSTTANEISFILTNYQAAASVAKEAGQDFQGLNAQNFNATDVLGWAAAESGYQPPSANPDSGLKSGNLDYFNLTAGSNWINQVACPSGANSYWACFGNFQGAAEAAIFSPTRYAYNEAPNVSAGFVLGQQLGSGASLATAFQAMSNTVHYAQNPNYGAGVQSAVNSIGSLLPCLQKNYASSF
jgi:RHS repeat-associated protein